MAFFSRHTGRLISEREHILQSIEMILTTPIGSRVMRRDFGSEIPRLIDQPLNRSTLTAIYAAANEAIATHEPRVEIIRTTVDATDAEKGIVNLRVTVRALDETLEEEFLLGGYEQETALTDATIPEVPITPPLEDDTFETFLSADDYAFLSVNDYIIGSEVV